MKRAIVFLLFLVLPACGTFETPPAAETARQRLAVAEISFGGIVRTVLTLRQSGAIHPGSTADRSIRTALETANTALIAWQATPDSQDAETAALAALTALQGVLLRLQQ